MYQICLCLNGSWKFLVLDEYLPCFPTTNATGGLVCSKSRSHPSSLWLPLLEKGICKHYSTYNLEETPITHDDILLMCTGAPLIKFGEDKTTTSRSTNGKSLRENPLYATNSAQNSLWNQLVEQLENQSLIICQTISFLTKVLETAPVDDAAGSRTSNPKSRQQQSQQKPQSTMNVVLTSENGLPFENTSLTLLRLFETSTQEHLMQFRSPLLTFPEFEWLGDWSDGSMKWTSQLEFEISLEIRQEVDTFWISFSDFLKYFSQITICCLRNEEVNANHQHTKEWTEHRTRSWFQLRDKDNHANTIETKTETETEHLNPSPSSPSSPARTVEGTCYPILSNMYVLKVSNESTEIHFTLHQLLRHSPSSASPSSSYSPTPVYHQFDIGLAVLRVTSDYTFELVASTDIAVSQFVSTSVWLSPDVYLLVPLTTGAHLLEYKARNQFKSRNLNLSPIGLFNHQEKKFTEEAEEVFSEIFDRLDNDMDDVCLSIFPLLLFSLTSDPSLGLNS
jgi:hypothetical protein